MSAIPSGFWTNHSCAFLARTRSRTGLSCEKSDRECSKLNCSHFYCHAEYTTLWQTAPRTDRDNCTSIIKYRVIIFTLYGPKIGSKSNESNKTKRTRTTQHILLVSELSMIQQYSCFFVRKSVAHVHVKTFH
jgi:hypothetical protein